jgi:hypothetical protein
MKSINLICIILVTVVWACNNSSGPDQHKGSTNPINFNNLQVGQKNYYVSYYSKNLYDTTNLITYLPDTLVVEVENLCRNIIFKEYLLDTTPKQIGYENERDSVCRYLVNIDENEIKFYKTNTDSYGYSHLFMRDIDSVRLSLYDFTNKPGTLHGWRVLTDSLGLDDSCYILNSVISGHNYDRLNVIFNDRPITYDGPAFTYIYSKSCGIIRSFESQIGSWLQRRIGWELIY